MTEPEAEGHLRVGMWRSKKQQTEQHGNLKGSSHKGFDVRNLYQKPMCGALSPRFLDGCASTSTVNSRRASSRAFGRFVVERRAALTMTRNSTKSYRAGGSVRAGRRYSVDQIGRNGLLCNGCATVSCVLKFPHRVDKVSFHAVFIECVCSPISFPNT